MSCIAGTVEKPLHWVRFRAGEAVELEGRICDRIQDFTSRRSCSSCPAYRGVRWDSSQATGVAPNGDPMGLTVDEYGRWTDAQEAALIEDDFAPMARFTDQMSGGMGLQSLARIGDPDALDTLAQRQREQRAKDPEHAKELRREAQRRYRAADPERANAQVRRWRADNPERAKEQNREAQRRYRARRKLVGNDPQNVTNGEVR